MEIFEQSLVAALGAAFLLSVALTVPLWVVLGRTQMAPKSVNVIIVADFVTWFAVIAAILHLGVLA